MQSAMHVYEVRPRKDHRGVAAISDALPFIIALVVGGLLVFILLYFGSFLVTRGQDAHLRSGPA
jgi:hypothetical protein